VGGLFVFFSCRVVMRSATSFLCTSRLELGTCDMAVSASRARFSNQFSCLACRLYFGAFCSRDISRSVNVMSVLLTTHGWKVLFCFGVIVCARLSLLSFKSSFLYVDCISLCRSSSLVCCMYGQVLSEVLAKSRCWL
jgi:hypothetical protein